MVVNDDVLGLVLERVDSHVSLIRAAAVCRRWRSTIADAAFLRRYRSLHAPAGAGDYFNSAWCSNKGPVFAPSSPSVLGARHFSLDFLPHGARSWTVEDSRGSLLLLFLDRRLLRHGFPEMVICEPLTRRFEIIPPPPLNTDEGHVYLMDGTTTEVGCCISMSNFRVICMFPCDGVMHTAMLTAGSSWSEKSICHSVPNFHSSDFLGRAGGSCYFCVDGTQGRTLVTLDGSTGDFTPSVFPAIGESSFVTELRDGKPHIINIFGDTLRVFAKLDSGKLTLAKSVLLRKASRGLRGYKPMFSCCDQYIFTRGTGFVVLVPQFAFKESWAYSIDLETMEAKRATLDMGPQVYRCELPWPPALHVHLDR